MFSPSWSRQLEKPLNTVSHFPAARTACSREAGTREVSIHQLLTTLLLESSGIVFHFSRRIFTMNISVQVFCSSLILLNYSGYNKYSRSVAQNIACWTWGWRMDKRWCNGLHESGGGEFFIRRDLYSLSSFTHLEKSIFLMTDLLGNMRRCFFFPLHLGLGAWWTGRSQHDQLTRSLCLTNLSLFSGSLNSEMSWID